MRSERLAMPWCRMSVVVALLLVTTATVSAQTTFQRHPQKDPYRKLFVDPAPKTVPYVTDLRQETRQKPFVVCGILIVPTDPSIDPKIRVGPPDRGVEHKLRTVMPPICRSR
jgi:hypothetical protein